MAVCAYALCRREFVPVDSRRRYCSRSCARYAQWSDMDPMQPMADRCAKFIMAVGDKRGVAPVDLARYIGEDFRRLSRDDRFRTCVPICKVPGIAFMADGDEFRFWPRQVAPEKAVRA